MVNKLRTVFLIVVLFVGGVQSQLLRHADYPLYSYTNALMNLQLAMNKNLTKNYVQLLKDHVTNIQHYSIFQEALQWKRNTSLRSAKCEQDIHHIVSEGGMSAFEWLDSMGHIPPGLMGGAVTWPGSFELCLSISDNIFPTFSNISSKYCSILMAVTQLKNVPMNLRIGIKSGFCLPRSCEPEPIFSLINRTIFKYGFEVDEEASYCHSSPESLPKDGWFCFAVIVALFSASIMLSGSAVDALLFHRWHHLIRKQTEGLDGQQAETDEQDEPLLDPAAENVHWNCVTNHQTVGYEPRKEVMRFWDYRSAILAEMHCVVQGICAFSIPYNLYKLFYSPRPTVTKEDGRIVPHPLICLDGIRVITMIWIIFGHTILFSMFTTNNLLLYVQTNFRRWTYQVVIGGTLSVDTFFMLSGLLSVYTAYPRFKTVNGLWKQMKFWMMFIFHRFMRMTPAYLLVLILYTGLFNHLTDGPFYPQRPQLMDIGFCRKHGWLTYLNNLIYSNKMCMVWTWYLANDFQFSVVLAPLFITLSNWSGSLGLIFSFVLVLSSMLTTFGIAYHADYLPGVLANVNDGFDSIYVKPYTRWGTYAIGLSLGWILIKDYKITKSWPKINKHVFVWISLAVSSVLCLSTVYGMYSLISGEVDSWPTGRSAFFTAAHRPAFTLGVAIVVYLCANNYTPPINFFLGMKFFSPMARLTYGAYLIHSIVLFFLVLGSQSVILMDNMYLITQFLTTYIVSYFLAIVINLATEAPLLNLEKLLHLR